MIKLILFDFDGTIGDSKDLAFKSGVRVLDEFNCEINRIKAMRLMGIKTIEFFKEMGIDPASLDEARKKFHKYFDKGAKEGDVKYCCSMRPLEELSKKYPLIIVSNSHRSYLKRVLRVMKIKNLFKEYYGGDEFVTKDEMLLKLFKKYKVMPHEALYVGDRFSDIEFARDAGCYAVAIHNEASWSNLNSIKREKPDFLIKDFDGLKKIVENLNIDYYS